MSSSVSLRGPRAATPSIKLARLSGVSIPLDPRINVWRPDLADIGLAGRVVVPRYASPVELCGRLPVATIQAAPDADSVCVSELLYGEAFAVFDEAAGWAWGQCGRDRYVGWVRREALGAPVPITHNVTAPQALLFALPSIKATVMATLPLGSAIAAVEHDGNFLSVDGSYIHRRHVAPLAGDPVDLAANFIGTPYRWGGRTRDGIDCSGLVQAVLGAHGIDCPRDSDQQLAAFPLVDFDDRRRGDLVAFPGHIGIMVDRERLLHANAFHMTTVVEPLADVVARLQPSCATPVLGVVRPPCTVTSASL